MRLKMYKNLSVNCFFVLAIFCAITIEIKSEETLLQTLNGEIAGSVKQTRGGKDYFEFLGIKYAESTAGANRFRPAVPAKPWTGVLNATKPGPLCAQLSKDGSTPSGSEDCLILDVFTKTVMIDAKQPVLVFIHGGALRRGNSGFDPNYFMDRDDIVFVSIQYRLGPFGFLSTKDEFAPGNYGFKDQILALQWLKKNIEAFGGDANLVTISGQSAGAMSVTAHVMSPMSNGLFHRAIAFSGSTVSQLKIDNVRYTHLLATNLGCALNSSEILVNCIRTKETNEILVAAGNLDFKENLAVMRWNYEIESPNSPNAFLTEHPNNILREGRHNRVPVLIGITKDEFAFWTERMVTRSQFKTEFNQRFDEIAPYTFMYERDTGRSKKISESLRSYYLKNESVSVENTEGLEKLFADTVISYGVHYFVELARKFDDVYYYRFNYKNGYTHGNLDSNKQPAGVFHSDDLQYMFVSTELRPVISTSDADNLIVQKMTGWITQFAKTGNPNNSTDIWISETEWSPSNTTNLLTLNINRACDLTTEPNNNRFEFLDNLFDEIV